MRCHKAIRTLSSIRNGARLLRKALRTILVSGNFGRQDLERHSPAQFRCVLREIDLAHPTRANFGNDAVMRDG